MNSRKGLKVQHVSKGFAEAAGGLHTANFFPSYTVLSDDSISTIFKRK